jgi:glycosyltransferase involved in cell wall biosynthesis
MHGPHATDASPKVTAIIPTYNWSTVLPYSIGSVLRQSFTDFELLVIGDGCTDESEQVVTSITDSRLRWINLPVNHGHQSAPNNEGIRQARGSIIAYLGHDDLWLPHHLEVMVAAIDAGADVAHSIVHIIGAEGNIMPPSWEMPNFEPGNWMAPTGVAHRRTASEKLGGWQDYRSLSIDPETDLWLRMQQAGFAFQFVPRLTAVKFPASFRKDIYKKRLSAEQQQWTARILKEKDLEAVETGKLLIAAELERRRQFYFSVSFRAAVARTSAKILRRLHLKSLRWVLGQPKPPKAQPKGAAVRQRQKFKGL